MKNKKQNFKYLDLGIYPIRLALITTFDKQYVNSKIGEFDTNDYHLGLTAYANLIINKQNLATIVIFLNFECEDEVMTHGTIAHEVSHAADYVFYHTQMYHDVENSNTEHYAYLIGYITSWVYENLNQWELMKLVKFKSINK